MAVLGASLTRVTLALSFGTALLLGAPEAHAIRPFITDDARVVGAKHLQLETWWRRDKDTLQHWALFAFGPNDHVELTLGGAYGLSSIVSRDPGVSSPTFAFNLPLLQGKFLLREAEPNSLPGFAVATGIVPPLGTGGLEPPGPSGFVYVAFTESLFDEERLLVHANLGATVLVAKGHDPMSATWGVGMQLRTFAAFHLVGEFFSGDPYAGGAGGAAQGGFRYIFNDHVQLDATIGGGVFGATPLPVWATSGIRLVSHDLW